MLRLCVVLRTWLSFVGRNLSVVVILWRGECVFNLTVVVFFQGEDGIRDLVRSRGLGDVYKRQG